MLAEAALALVDEAGGEQEVTLSHTGDGRAGSGGASTSQGSGTTFCFLPPFLACFLSLQLSGFLFLPVGEKVSISI